MRLDKRLPKQNFITKSTVGLRKDCRNSRNSGVRSSFQGRGNYAYARKAIVNVDSNWSFLDNRGSSHIREILKTYHQMKVLGQIFIWRVSLVKVALHVSFTPWPHDLHFTPCKTTLVVSVYIRDNCN